MAPTRAQLVELTTDPVTFLTSDEPILRRMATTALTPDQALENIETLVHLTTDGDASIRAAAAEKLGTCGDEAFTMLETLEHDPDPTVREAVATAYGEVGSPDAIAWLASAASDDIDKHVKEAATAALGAIGDDAGLETLLHLISNGPPQVRRRAIAAITIFDDERVEPAIRRAALDRNPGVREAAEMVVGKQLTETSQQRTADRASPARGDKRVFEREGLRAREPGAAGDLPATRIPLHRR